MAATAAELTSIRLAIGDTSEATFTDLELQAIWDDSVDQHTIADRRVVRYQVIVDCFDAILVDSAKMATYRQNSAAENLSDIFKALMKLRDKHQKKLDAAIAGTQSAVKLGVMKKVPTREKEWPDS